MKKLLIFFLCFVALYVLIKPKAISKYCSQKKFYNNLSTINFDKVITGNDLKDVQKICTDNVCTYNLDNNSYYLIKRHVNNFLKTIKDEDKKYSYLYKGFKIDSIYTINCS